MSNIGPTIERIAENSIWNIVEKKDWDRIFLPLIVVGRLDALLKEAYEKGQKKGHSHRRILDGMRKGAVKLLPFHNTWVKPDHFEAGTPLTWIAKTSKGLPPDLMAYLEGFPEDTKKILRTLELLPNEANPGTINWLEAKGKMAKKDILGILIGDMIEKIPFASFSRNEMGEAFEDCLRMFNEAKKTDAGEHYTPRDAIALLARILINGDIPEDGETIDFYDPTNGTGGILMEGKTQMEARCQESRRSVQIELYGQELMAFTHGICQADLLLRGMDFTKIKLGDTLADDQHPGKTFRYTGANPPYGVKWKSIEAKIRAEAAKGTKGRFPGGCPKTVQEGQLLFLQHMVSKMRPVAEGGGRVAVVMNGNPLFAADAGEGDSEIRGYVLKNDLVEAIIALPKEMFFNTGIATYIWVLTNNKKPKRKGVVQLIDASGMGTRMSKSLGNKRNILTPETIKEICSWHQKGASEETDERCKVVPNEFFGYHSVDIEEPLTGQKKPKKDTERIPLLDCPDGSEGKLKAIIKEMRPKDAKDFKVSTVTVGWEIPFTQIFYKYQAPEDPLQLAKKVDSELMGLHIDTSFFKK
jgi:type I restriction enzyme M protein